MNNVMLDHYIKMAKELVDAGEDKNLPLEQRYPVYAGRLEAMLAMLIGQIEVDRRLRDL